MDEIGISNILSGMLTVEEQVPSITVSPIEDVPALFHETL